jgi:hypothetical protein
MLNGGLTCSPSQVYLIGILPLFEKTELVIFKEGE